MAQAPVQLDLGGLFGNEVAPLNLQELSPILQVAYYILSDMPGKNGHVNDIAQIAVDKGYGLGADPTTFASKLSSALSVNIKKKDTLFAKVAGKKIKGKTTYRKGMYRLKKVTVKTVTAIEPPAIGTDFLGKAGELAVMSELLFWGFNASLMTVDKGIDIVASNDSNKYFHIQVKTTRSKANNQYYFSINKKSFEANDNGNTYYIFVLRHPSRNQFVVLPSSYIRILHNQGFIKGIDSISINIAIQDKTNRFILSGKDDITTFVGNFEQIK